MKIKGYVALFLYIFGLGLIGQSQLSEVFSIRLKLGLSVFGLIAVVDGFAVQQATRKKFLGATSACTVDQIPAVFDCLRREGKEGSFAVFMFQPTNAPKAEDAVNIQFSIEDGHAGLDWCLIGSTNVRDRKKVERFTAALGCAARLREMNQVKYLRIEQGDLPHLCQKVIIDLYAQRPDAKLTMVLEGFSWP
jgi:hypothetical protein